MKKFLFFLMTLSVSAYGLAAKDYFVADFGARADGVTLNSKSIQAAIDFASANGGGRVVFTPGNWVTGTVYVKDNVTLHLESGATLLGSLNPWDYVKDPYVGWTSMIFALKQKNIGITGGGTIDGRGFTVANHMVEYIHRGLFEDPLKLDRPNEVNRPQNIYFRECDGVTIKDVFLKDPGSWNQTYDQCHNVYVEGIRVDSKSYWNNDGIDIVDCEDVIIRNCYIDAADDIFCFKSHSANHMCKNVLLENCVGRSSANGIKFGTVSKGGFKNFTIRNMTIFDTYRSAITFAAVDGAEIENITVDGIRSLHTGNVIFLRTGERWNRPKPPYMRNIVIRNVYAEVPLDKPDAGYNYEGPIEDLPRNISPCIIAGIPNHKIENVLMENIEIVFPGGGNPRYAYRGTTPQQLAAIPEWERRYPEFSMWKELPAWGLYLRHADGITLDNVILRVEDNDYRPAIVADDINGLTLRHTVIKEKKRQPNTSQLIANNVTGLKKQHTTVATRQQKGTRDNLSGIDASATTSDHVTKLNNAIPGSEDNTPYKASLFGCKSDGRTLNTSSIQRALNYIADHGGGTLVFEVGRYLTGSLHIPAGVHIHLNEGAILVGSQNPFDYDLDAQGHPALLISDSGHKIDISGLGHIETNTRIEK